MEAEANYAAGRLLFMADQFNEVAMSSPPSIALIKSLSTQFGNTITSTLWRFVEQAEAQRPMVALVTGHPHPSRRKPDFDTANPCRYCIQSPLFRANFGRLSDKDLFGIVSGYSGPQRGGTLGQAEVRLVNDEGQPHDLQVRETFYNGYEALTLGIWEKSDSCRSSYSRLKDRKARWAFPKVACSLAARLSAVPLGGAAARGLAPSSLSADWRPFYKKIMRVAVAIPSTHSP